MPKIFVPARNSRHRTACFALYRALIRQSARVPLPDNLVSAPGLTGPVHPIKHLVRKGFRRNQIDTSPRLVISALRNGYRFLDMLTAAQSTSTPEYTKIHEFIRIRQARKSIALSLRSLRGPPPPKPSSAPNPNTIPLLTRVSAPNEPPQYEPTVRPRPLSELGGTGIRRVPVLDLAANFPYLRQTKPQTLIMNRIIRQKADTLQDRVAQAMVASEHPQEAAKWEDAWDSMMDREMGTQAYPIRDPSGSFKDSQKTVITAAFARLEESRLDSYARASAMQKLVQEERALRDKERIERRDQRRQEREAWKAAGVEPATAHGQCTPTIPGEGATRNSIETAKELATEVGQSEPSTDPARTSAIGSLEKAEEPTSGSSATTSKRSPVAKAATKRFTRIKRIPRE